MTIIIRNQIWETLSSIIYGISLCTLLKCSSMKNSKNAIKMFSGEKFIERR